MLKKLMAIAALTVSTSALAKWDLMMFNLNEDPVDTSLPYMGTWPEEFLSLNSPENYAKYTLDLKKSGYSMEDFIALSKSADEVSGNMDGRISGFEIIHYIEDFYQVNIDKVWNSDEIKNPYLAEDLEKLKLMQKHIFLRAQKDERISSQPAVRDRKFEFFIGQEVDVLAERCGTEWYQVGTYKNKFLRLFVPLSCFRPQFREYLLRFESTREAYRLTGTPNQSITLYVYDYETSEDPFVISEIGVMNLVYKRKKR